MNKILKIVIILLSCLQLFFLSGFISMWNSNNGAWAPIIVAYNIIIAFVMLLILITSVVTYLIFKNSVSRSYYAVQILVVLTPIFQILYMELLRT